MRQLQAETVSEVMVKPVEVARLPLSGEAQARPGSCSRWASKLDQEKQTLQKRRQRLEVKLQVQAQQRAQELQPRQLRVEPRLLSPQLASRLPRGPRGPPESPWEEPLAQALRAAPQKLDREPTRTPYVSGHQQRLLSFLQCCVVTEQLPLAHHVLVSYHSKPRRQQLLTLPMYNTVLLGWARKVGTEWERGSRACSPWGRPCCVPRDGLTMSPGMARGHRTASVYPQRRPRCVHGHGPSALVDVILPQGPA